MFWYWNRGLLVLSRGFPGKGASSEPQAMISSVQKLMQMSPPLQAAGTAAVIRSPAGPAWGHWVPAIVEAATAELIRHPSVLPAVSVTLLVPTANDAHVAMHWSMLGYWAFALVQFVWILLQ